MPYDGNLVNFEVDAATLRRRQLCKALREGLDNYKFQYDIFDNKNSQHKCGTAGCVAGYIAFLFPEFISSALVEDELIGEVVGFDINQTGKVFYYIGDKYGCSMPQVTGEQAAEYIEELMGDV